MLDKVEVLLGARTRKS